MIRATMSQPRTNWVEVVVVDAARLTVQGRHHHPASTGSRRRGRSHTSIIDTTPAMTRVVTTKTHRAHAERLGIASISSEMRIDPISAVIRQPVCAANATPAAIGASSRVLAKAEMTLRHRSERDEFERGIRPDADGCADRRTHDEHDRGGAAADDQ